MLLFVMACATAPWIATTGQIITEKYDCDFGELLEIPDIPSEERQRSLKTQTVTCIRPAKNGMAAVHIFA